MGNELDELKDEGTAEGRDAKVIDKQLPVTVGSEATLFQVGIWVLPIIIGIVLGLVAGSDTEQPMITTIVCGLIGLVPGIVFYFKKVKAEAYLLQLQQKIQHDASQIDNYLENRVVILKNAAKILEKGINLDKETFTKIAALRSGANVTDEERNDLASQIDAVTNDIKVAFERYPDLKAHNEIEDVMQQNSYLQREITAAREVYNDAVLAWNREIYVWPVNKIVAAKKGYTTRIPFSASQETKDEARSVMF